MHCWPSHHNCKSAALHHGEAHRRAWGSSLWGPKHHYLMHLPEMYNLQGVVCGCFIHERKHRVAKRFSENLRNVNEAFEVSILKEVLHVNLTDLQKKEIDKLHVGLVKAVVTTGPLVGLLQSVFGIKGPIYHAKQAHYCVGALGTAIDFVLLDLDGIQRVGEVMFFAEANEVPVACVNLWAGQGSNVFVKTEENVVCDLIKNA